MVGDPIGLSNGGKCSLDTDVFNWLQNTLKGNVDGKSPYNVCNW